jgi:hypothetical protein
MYRGSQYVVLEWNQASGTPRIAVDDLFDDAAEARDIADELRKEAGSNDRRERYTFHEVDMEEVNA